MNYRVLVKGAFDVLGIRRTTPYGGGTWGIAKSDGTAEKLQKIGGHPCDLGLCFGFDDNGNNDYMCGIEYSGKDIEGLDRYQYPPAAWLVFTASGTVSGGVLEKTWKLIYSEFMPESGYKQMDLPTIEQYIEWDESKDVCRVDILIPVHSK